MKDEMLTTDDAPREYPAAPDRSGKEADFKNYPSFLRNLRKALDGTGRRFGLSITIVSRLASGEGKKVAGRR